MIETAHSVEEILLQLKHRRRTPVATYRLQLHEAFPFSAAIDVIPYISRLGVSDCYTSPLLKAGPGSRHGYDIVDHNQLNPELGTEMDYEAFVSALEKNRLHHLLDFVPNHMGVYPDTNLWWRDVLENGPWSPFAHYFDIEWHPVKPELRNKVLLPILGDPYGVVLERGELQLEFLKGSLCLRYFEKNLPINPTEIPRVFERNLQTLRSEHKDDTAVREFLSILTALRHLPTNFLADDKEHIEERQREKEVARERLARLVRESPLLQDYLQSSIKAFNGTVGAPRSFDALHELLEAQYYRLADWRTASHEINYRRFFDVNQLAGVRMEWKEVFDATHGLIKRLLGENKIRGLRLDHPDGLYDPATYFENLQNAFLEGWVQERLARRPLTAEDQTAIQKWHEQEKRPLYVVGEKILSTNEFMPVDWALDGSSGYDFLNDVNRLFVDPKNAATLKETYGLFTGQRMPLEEVVCVSKRLIMTTTMASELNVLAHALNRISEGNRCSRDFTLESLRDALREVVAYFPVYRTFINAKECTPLDRQIIDRAVFRARRRNPAMEPTIFRFVREVLIPQDVKGLEEWERQRRLEFSMKFQQYTGPVQAKGLEDTAFYRYNALVSLNEVGGDPNRFGSSVKEFHDLNVRRRRDWPHSLLATSTHDTKRGEDARARINLLSEFPDEWKENVLQWTTLTQNAKMSLDGEVLPSANDEYLFYQALLGIWEPRLNAEARKSLAERMRAYMNKAIREAKLQSSWIAPNEEYEKAVDRFVAESISGASCELFWKSFSAFAERLAALGTVNSLAQTLLKITSPGVPDFYQGTELWDLTLVDPDNRRPVDYALRKGFLEEFDALAKSAEDVRVEKIRQTFAEWMDGKIKFFVTTAALRFRLANPEIFLEGTYVPLAADGVHADHCVAFARVWGDRIALVVAPRLVRGVSTSGKHTGLDWKDTQVTLPPKWTEFSWQNILTGESVAFSGGKGTLQTLLQTLPVGLYSNQKNTL